MKTIYTAILAQLKAEVPALKWIDFDTGQLDQSVRAGVAFPCVLLTIDIPDSKDVDSRGLSQDCLCRITAQIAFNNTPDRTNAGAPDEARMNGLAVYDTISDVYAALQGFETEHFNALSRRSQGKVPRSDGMFLYRIVFECDFIDETAG